MKKISVVIIGIIVLFLVGLFVIKSLVQSHLNPQALQSQLTKAIGVNVRMNQVNVSWSGSVKLSGVKLDENGNQFLSTKSATVRLRLSELLHGTIVIQSLNLDSPNLVLDPQVAHELSSLFHQKNRNGPSFPVSFTEGAFTYKALNGKAISLSPIDGEISSTNPQGTPFSLMIKDRKNGTYALSGTVTADSLDLKGTMKSVSFNEIVAPFGINPVPELQGEIDGKFSATGPLNHLALETDFTQKSGFFKGNAILTATLLPTETGAFLKGKLYSDRGTIEGVGDFKGFGVNFSTPKQGLVFQDGTIDFPSGLVQFSGAIQKNNTISVIFKSAAFNPFTLPNFSGWGIQASNGQIHGVATGTFPHLLIKISGLFPKLQMGENELNQAFVDIIASIGVNQATLSQFSLKTKQSSLSLTGNVRWNDARDLDVSFSRLDGAAVAQIFHLQNKLSPLKMTASGTLHYDHDKKIWTGSVMTPNGMVAGESFDNFKGDFSYAENKPVQFSGIFSMGKRTAELNGTWNHGEATIKLDAVAFPIEQIPFLKTKVSGFHGFADVHAHINTASEAQNEIQFSLSSASYRGKTIPNVEGTINMKGDVVNFPSLRFTSLSPPLSISGDYNLKSKEMRVNLPTTNPPISLSGTVDSAHQTIQLHTTLRGQSIAELAKVAGKSMGETDGNLYGAVSLSGFPPNTTLHFSGIGKNLKFGSMDLGSANLNLNGSAPGKLDIRVSGILASQVSTVQKQFPGLNGELGFHAVMSGPQVAAIDFQLIHGVWKGKAFPSISGTVIWREPIAQFSHLNLGAVSPPLSASGVVNSNTHEYHFDSKLSGQKIYDLTRLMGISNQSLHGSLYGPMTITGTSSGSNVHFSGTVNGLQFNNMGLGSGHIDFTAQEDAAKNYTVHLAASSISASTISLLSSHYPGMEGTANFDAKMNTSNSNQAAINFALVGASYHGRSFPDVSAACSWNAPLLSFSSITLSKLSPPITLTGQYDSGGQSLQLSGSLAGQLLSDLMVLAGSSSSEANGHLYGPLNIDGSSSAPRIRFQGEIRGLSYRGIQLGTGKLQITASSTALNGKLVLNNPASLGGQNSFLGGLVNQIPGLGGQIGQVITHVTITGVLISGSPHNPKFTPMVQNLTTAHTSAPGQPGNVKEPNNPVFDILNQVLGGNKH